MLKQQGSSSKSVNKGKRKENPITEQVVTQHLKELGYEATALHPSDLQDFILELQDLWEKNGLKEFPRDEEDEEDEECHQEFESKSLAGQNTVVTSGSGYKITRHEYHSASKDSIPGNTNTKQLHSFNSSERNLQDSHEIVTIKSGPDHDTDEYHNIDSDVAVDQAANILSSLDLNGFKQKATEQKLKSKYGADIVSQNSAADSRSSSPEIYTDEFSSFEEYSSRKMHDISLISRPTTTSSTNSRPATHPSKASGLIKVSRQTRAIKKNDPVSRFHQHNNHWQKDTFLKRQDKKTISREPGRWGGMAAIIHEQPTKIRHNLNAKRSDYVIPSLKKRTDLVWETRQRMANIDK